MNFSEKFKCLLLARTPIVVLYSTDDNAVDDFLQENLESSENVTEFNGVLGKVNFTTKARISTGNKTLSEYLEFLSSTTDFVEPIRRIIVLKDTSYQLTQKQDDLVRLKNIAAKTANRKIENFSVVVIIVSTEYQVPELLKPYSVLLQLPLPDENEIKKIIQSEFDMLFSRLEEIGKIDKLCLLLKGMNKHEIIHSLSLASTNEGNPVPWLIEHKRQIIEKNGLLEYVLTSPSICNEVGGLDNLRDFLKKKKQIFDNWEKAKEFGVDVPKGILLVGMPGCGKTLSVKFAASLFSLPLYRLDIGTLLGKYVGESEEKLRKALVFAEAASPCVLWLDELEKAFSGLANSDGSGTMQRLFGYFLTWLQEKTAPVYLIATANNIKTLPPELMRKGRFDEMFFIGFPSREEREKIFKIHIEKRKKGFEDLKLNALNDIVSDLAKNTNGYSGADIEAIVKTGVERAFVSGKTYVSDIDLKEALSKTDSVSSSLEKPIEELKNTLKNYKFVNASKDSGDNSK